jgi:hypothetical protein
MSEGETSPRPAGFRLRSGIWFAGSVALILLAWYGGNELYTRLVILPRKYPLLTPGDLDLIGIKVGGYSIKVSNGIATLEEGSGGAFGPSSENTSSGSGTVIPMRALIGALRFDPQRTSELAAALAGVKNEIEPLQALVWRQADVEKALAGNVVLAHKLEYDLSTTLSGKPLDKVNWLRLSTGIWIALEVPVQIPSSQGAKTVVATMTIPYKTRLAAKATADIQAIIQRSHQLSPSASTISGAYSAAANELSSVGMAEDVKASLNQILSEASLNGYSHPVENLLSNVVVLSTEKQIEGASIHGEETDSGDGKVFTLTLDVTSDSRDRLWQFTYRKPGAQLLLVSKGIAIAAPFVQHVIKYSSVTITGIVDEDLARDALATIQKQRRGGTK